MYIAGITFIGTSLQKLLKNTKSGYNQRPNSAFGYKSPLEVMSAKNSNLLQQVCGH